MKKYISLGTILLGAALTLLMLTPDMPDWTSLALGLAAMALVGWEILVAFVACIREGSFFNELLLMLIASIGAFIIGERVEAAAVLLLFRIGEFVEEYASNRVRESIKAAAELTPKRANLERDGEICVVAPETVHPGDVIVIKPGERIPLDGVVISGRSLLDKSALTGESLPESVGEGDGALSGSVNGQGALRVRVEAEYADSQVARIIELIEEAAQKKAPSERFIRRFARIYTPAVTVAAALIAIVPMLFIGWSDVWLYRALVFLVASCPCALVISIPMSFFAGLGAASRAGILIKGGNVLEALEKVDFIALDKTGTLTEGKFSVDEIITEMDETAFLSICAQCESLSNHPLAQSVREEYAKRTGAAVDSSDVSDYQELEGLGVRLKIGGVDYLAGNARLMEQNGIAFEPPAVSASSIFAACGSEYLGCVTLRDKLKPDAAEVLKALPADVCMLTGDNRAAAERIGRELGIEEIYSGLLPGDKVGVLEKIMKKHKKTMFVGDGINDAPSLVTADVGVTFANAADISAGAADVALLSNELKPLVHAFTVAKRTGRAVRGNIAFALAVKLIVLALGVAGYAHMWLAVFADVGVTLIVLLNALRVMVRTSSGKEMIVN